MNLRRFLCLLNIYEKNQLKKLIKGLSWFSETIQKKLTDKELTSFLNPTAQFYLQTIGHRNFPRELFQVKTCHVKLNQLAQLIS